MEWLVWLIHKGIESQHNSIVTCPANQEVSFGKILRFVMEWMT
jgi:hypothetical protein